MLAATRDGLHFRRMAHHEPIHDEPLSSGLMTRMGDSEEQSGRLAASSNDVDAAVTAAFWRAREEAVSWTRVYEQVRITAILEARACGMSYSEIAERWDLSKAMVTRHLVGLGHGWPMDQPEWGEPELRRFDDLWIDAGSPATATPGGQHRRGLIDNDQYAQLLAQETFAPLRIDEQLGKAVREHPGLPAHELAPYMRVAINAQTSPAAVPFRRYADAAQVAVDGAGRYWPTLPLSELRIGDRIPRNHTVFTSAPDGGEWATVTGISKAADGAPLEVVLTLDDGAVMHWRDLSGPSRFPVDRLE